MPMPRPSADDTRLPFALRSNLSWMRLRLSVAEISCYVDHVCIVARDVSNR